MAFTWSVIEFKEENSVLTLVLNFDNPEQANLSEDFVKLQIKFLDPYFFIDSLTNTCLFSQNYL